MAGELRTALAALAAAAVLAGCGGGDEEPRPAIGSDDATLAADPAEAVGSQVPGVETVPRPEQTMAAGRLTPVNESGVTGSVNLRGIGEATEVSMNVTGVQQGTPRVDVAVVRGTCEAPGADVAAVGPLTAGPGDIFAITDTVAIPPGTLMDGGHALVVRAVEAMAGVPPLACSPLPEWRRDPPAG